MKFPLFLSALCALAAFYAVSVSASPMAAALPEASAGAEPLTLVPIHNDVFNHATGLRRRDALRDYSKLKLHEKATFVYGAKSDGGDYYMANMTLYGPQGMRVVNMEVFEDLTSKVDCKGDDGELSLTFKDKEAQTYALKEWSWINEKEKDKFIIVTNHKGCSPADERQAYIIHKVDQVNGTLKTRLLGKPAPLSDVAETFDLDFGSVEVDQLEKRQLSASRTFSFGVNAGTPGKRFNIFADNPNTPIFKIDCVNCYVQGRFKVTGRVKVFLTSITELKIHIRPENVAACLELEAALGAGANAAEPPQSWRQSKELVNGLIPGASIRIGDIFSLGADLKFAVAAAAELRGAANFTFGAAASLPSGGRVTIDVLKPLNSGQKGLAPTFEPRFKVNSLKGSVGASATAETTVGFGIKVLRARLRGFVELKAPVVAADLTQVEFCPGATAKYSNARLTSTVGVVGTIGAEASFWGNSVKPKKEVFNLKRDLLNDCIPF